MLSRKTWCHSASSFFPRVIYLNISESEALLTLQNRLEVFLDEKLDAAHRKEQRPYRPHMTLATRVPGKAVFRQVWDEVKNESVNFNFVADTLYLLRHTMAKWEIMESFSFGGVTTK
jgi:2'-5' RNA ligase